MLTDLHAHSSGISKCCRIPYNEVIQTALQNGIDAIVLTNHYQSSYIGEDGLDGLVEKYIAEYTAAEAYGASVGCRVIFGIEVTAELYPNVHMLIYGVQPSFLRKHPSIFGYTQREMYEAVKAENGLLIQAHPFRNGTTVLPIEYLDGVEINCHPLYKKSHSEELYDLAKQKRMILTVGGDYHADTYRPKCGMVLPDGIKNTVDLKEYLEADGEKLLTVQEPDTQDIKTLLFHCRTR